MQYGMKLINSVNQFFSTLLENLKLSFENTVCYYSSQEFVSLCSYLNGNSDARARKKA